jgi:type III secretory pathway component EscS
MVKKSSDSIICRDTPAQKALTPRILQALSTLQHTTLDAAISQLTVGAFFFAMRSCEYSKVSKSEERRTKLLTVHNIRFFRHRWECPHNHHALHLADSVSITFEFQKNDERDVTITMHRTGDATLCPVISWSSIVRRIRAIPGTSDSSPVCTYLLTDGTTGLVTSKQILDRLRDRVTAIGKDVLGFEAWEVGTHSIRSAAAMAMYLAGVPVYTIMLIGRWSSDAFLRYIRRQVQEFSAGVSRRMILSEDFFTIPESAHQEDPRNRNQCHNFSERSHIGLDAQRLSTQPTFALWH